MKDIRPILSICFFTLLFCALFSVHTESSYGAIDAYLKLDDIEGESIESSVENRSSIFVHTETEGGGSANIIIKSTIETENESGEKGGTEDINIGVGELQEDGDDDRPIIMGTIPNPKEGSATHEDISVTVQGEGDKELEIHLNKNDLIKILSTDGGIIITTSDSKKNGNVEYEFEVEEGESNKEEIENVTTEDSSENRSKPKEIVVVGSKVRLSVEKIGEGTEIHINTEDVHSEEDLALFATKKVEENTNIEEISLNFEKIKVKYNTKAKLLGFLPITLTQDIEVETEEGEINVASPWWGFLARKEIEPQEISTAIEKKLNESASSFAQLVENNQKQALYLEIVANILEDASVALVAPNLIEARKSGNE